MAILEFNGAKIEEAPFPDPRGKKQLFISDMPSVGKDKYNRLLDNGFNTLNDLYQASESEIMNIEGIGPITARNIKIWVGDQLVTMYEILDIQIPNDSIEEVKNIYNISETTAHEVQDKYDRQINGTMTHISDISSKEDR